MGWYKSGKISVIFGQKIVTGEGTDFFSNVQSGFAFLGPDLFVYEIDSIQSGTQLTLADAYRGNSASEKSYAIFPTQGVIVQLSQIATNLLNTFGAFRDAYNAGDLVGQGLELKDILSRPDQLPASASVGDAYMIGTSIYVFSSAHTWLFSDISGPHGPPNVLVIGTVSSGDVASAEISGDSPSQILNLVLPKGGKGDQGLHGPANELTIGTVTSGDIPSVEIEGDSPNQVLNFVLAKGGRGDLGPHGPPNVLSIGTVESGVTPSAEIEGEAPNQILNLVLAKGDRGDFGPAGIRPTGAWDAGTPYLVNDTVLYSGSQYLRLVQGVTSENPSSDTLNWQLFASKGSDGVGTGTVVTVNTVFPSVAGDVTLTKANIGLANVDNTSDISKPISNAVQSALNSKPTIAVSNLVQKSEKGAINGVVPLDGTGLISSVYLPSYVDDVIEVSSFSQLPLTGESGKIYITIDSNNQYRWSGSIYIKIVSSPGNSDAVPEGISNLYFTAARVIGVVLSGFSLVTGGSVVATDSVLAAMGKFQNQINDLQATISALSNSLIDKVSKTTNETISGAKTFSIRPIVGTATPLTNDTSSASTAYVDAAVAVKSPRPTLVNTIYCSVVAGTVTLTGGSPLQISGHKGSVGSPISITGGTFGVGINAGATYYLVDLGGGSVGLALTPGGVPINTTGSFTGVKTAITPPYDKSINNISFAIVKLWAGGGGGGGLRVKGASGGGQAGGYSQKKIRGTDMPALVPITIGLGGVGGLGSNSINGARGATGGTTSFGSIFFATGGAGGEVSSNNGDGGPGGGGTAADGLGVGGDLNLKGNRGMPGIAGVGSQTQGSGGLSSLGGGPVVFQGSQLAANSGGDAWPNSAAGGSGANIVGSGSVNGGAGGDGFMIIEEYAV